MCQLGTEYLEQDPSDPKKEYKLTEYEKSPPQIKVTLGLVSLIFLYEGAQNEGANDFCNTLASLRFGTSPVDGRERNFRQDV